MALGENISFIKSQLDLCDASVAVSDREAEQLRTLYFAVGRQISETQQRIRELRQALTQPANVPSRTIIEQIVRLQGKISSLRSAQESVDELTDELYDIALNYSEVAAELRGIKDLDLSVSDIDKVRYFQQELQRQLSVYGFVSFSPTEILLSDDNFRPIVNLVTERGTREQELGFEISASDSIRLKWAYYLALLETAIRHNGNHLGLLIFDEPAQHAVEVKSLEAFLRYAVARSGDSAQVIAAVTSEKATGFISDLVAHGAHVTSFPGLLLQPLDGDLHHDVFA